jgi:hypothetical protein
MSSSKELTPAETIIVYAVLSRWDEGYEDEDPASSSRSMQIRLSDVAEWQAMNNLLCVLESKVEHVFSADYSDQLAAAK